MPSKISALGSMKKSIRPDDTRPVETPQPDVANVSEIPDVPLPDVNTLSLLATQPRFTSLDSELAVGSALALWRDAQSLIATEREVAALRKEGYHALLNKIKQPQQFPASYSVFLRLVVQGKDEGEQLSRFRRYWISEIRREKAFKTGQTPKDGPSSEAEMDELEKIIADFKATPISEQGWGNLKFNFIRWWFGEKLEAKRRAGNARVAKTRRKKIAKPG
jgi:hypothetical protein